MPQNFIKTQVSNVISAIQEDDNNAKAVFSAKTELQTGLKCSAQIRNFSFQIDEPVQLGGTDEGPNPVELVLAALGTCQEIVYSAYAAVLGIHLNSVKVNVKGNLNLKGFFGLDENIHPGFEDISYTTFIDSPASSEQLNQLVKVVEKHCPVLDILTREIPVKGNVKLTNSLFSVN